MVLSKQLGTLKKTRLNHDVSDLEVGALERARVPSWMNVQNVFPLSELVIFHVSSCLELTEV
jgi:hypothetical protein